MGFFKKKNNVMDEYFDKSLLKRVLDYNQDNIVDIKDITDLSKDIESSLSDCAKFLKDQLDELRK